MNLRNEPSIPYKLLSKHAPGLTRLQIQRHKRLLELHQRIYELEDEKKKAKDELWDTQQNTQFNEDEIVGTVWLTRTDTIAYIYNKNENDVLSYLEFKDGKEIHNIKCARLDEARKWTLYKLLGFMTEKQVEQIYKKRYNEE